MNHAPSEAAAFPPTTNNDPDDVVWALQVGQAEWARGALDEALDWIRRAAESAVEVGAYARARQLNQIASQLTEQLTPAADAEGVVANSEAAADDDAIVLDEVDEFIDDGVELLEEGEEVDDGVLEVGADEVELSDADSLELEGDDDDDEPLDPADFEPAESGAVSVAANELLDEIQLSPEEFESPPVASVAFDLSAPVSLPAFSAPGPSISPSGTVPPSVVPSSRPLTSAEVTNAAPLGMGPASEPPPSARVSVAPVPSSRPPLSDPAWVPEIVQLLGEVPGLSDVPSEVKVRLARAAQVTNLEANDEIAVTGLAVLGSGAANVMPTLVDVACSTISRGGLLYGRGSVSDGVELRLVALEDSTRVATWSPEVVEETMRLVPWLLDELRAAADRFQTVAGVVMGPLGERLDDMLRNMVTERCAIRRCAPGEEIVGEGKPVGGMRIVGAGGLELRSAGSKIAKRGPGDFLFPAEVLTGRFAPASAYAGKGGALLLCADRMTTHELLVSVPPLLEVLSGQ